MVGASNGSDQIDWSWLCMLKGGWMCLQKNKRPSSRLMPVQAIKSGGDCGPDTAAWLLNEHGPALYRSRSPETCNSIREALRKAWSTKLRSDPSGDDGKTFVQQRLEQVPHAAMKETLEEQIETTLQALLRCEEDEPTESIASAGSDTPPGACDGGTGATGGKEPRVLPYWFLPADWARLSEAYQVDFVLHGLPGTENSHCVHCGCSGHLHVGQRPPGTDLSLHVGWRGRGRKSGGSGDATSNSWGHWEPLGSGPIQAPFTRQKSSLESEIDFASIRVDSSVEANTATRSSNGGVVEDLLHETLASLGCLESTQPGPCGQVGKSCPKLKDCCNADRRVSEDGLADLDNAQTNDEHTKLGDVYRREGGDSMNEKATAECEGGSAIVPQQPLVSTSARSYNAGARFSVMLEGISLFHGAEFSDAMQVPRRTGTAAISNSDTADIIDFKSCFVESVAVAAGISQSRVQVIDVSLPFEAHTKTHIGKHMTPNSKESPSKQPDIGAGVLSFLTDDEEASLPALCDTTPPRATAPPPTPASPEADINVVRILAVIREVKLDSSSTHSEEPDAMMSLELVVNELQDPKSSIHDALRNRLNGRVHRIWCPEAEGPCKGPHHKFVARNRRAFPRVQRAD